MLMLQTKPFRRGWCWQNTATRLERRVRNLQATVTWHSGDAYPRPWFRGQLVRNGVNTFYADDLEGRFKPVWHRWRN